MVSPAGLGTEFSNSFFATVEGLNAILALVIHRLIRYVNHLSNDNVS